MPREEIEVIARAVIRRGGAILACRNLKKGYFYLPGGHVEFGEPAAAALAREIMEETGLRAKIGPMLLACEAAFRARGREHHELNLVFAAGLPARRGVSSLEKGIGFEWLDLASIGRADLRPRMIRRWLAGMVRSTWNVGSAGRAASRWSPWESEFPA